MNFGRSAIEHEELILPYEVGYQPLPRQVVTLAYLSRQIPASHLSDQLARSLCAETESTVVLVRLEQQEESIDITHPELFLNGEFHLPSRIRRTDAGYYTLTLAIHSDSPTPAGIASLISRLSRHFRYLLIETAVSEQPAAWLPELLLRSNLAYLFFKPNTEDVHRLELVTREARPRCRNSGVHIKPIACLAENEQVNGFDALAQRVGCPTHLFVHHCPAPDSPKSADTRTGSKDLFLADIRRLAREIGGRLVGLALSSGAAKGFSHIGVIQVLEENGIEVDVVAGASMGAYVGAVWCHGFDGPELERLARELEGRWSLWSLIDPAFPPRRGFLRGFAVKKRLMRSLGTAHFGDLTRPIRVVAANLATLERMVFSSGEVAAAVHASIAVPGICVPITIDGETYTDGGIVDPLPVDVLRDMGANRVIAVNVIPTPDRIRYGIQAELELARNKEPKESNGFKLFRKVPPLDRQVNYFARGNLLEILMRSVHGAQIRMAEASCERADLVLRPDIYDDCWLDYGNPGKFIKLGREVAERHIEEIKALVARKEAIHEQELAPESMAALI